MSVDVRAKLAEKGLVLPVTSKPLAAYVPATRTGNLVFTAGQLPLVDGKIVKEGKVGSDLTVDEAKALAENELSSCGVLVALGELFYTQKNTIKPFLI